MKGLDNYLARAYDYPDEPRYMDCPQCEGEAGVTDCEFCHGAGTVEMDMEDIIREWYENQEAAAEAAVERAREE